MKRFRVLDLFCGAGGASMGLYDAWPDAQIVGVDIKNQPNYPFGFNRTSALTFPLEGYDFIWASPPCQKFSKTHDLRKNNHPDLVDAIRQRLIKTGKPYCIENVPEAPLIDPVMLCGAMFGLSVYRHRIFETNFPVLELSHPAHIWKQNKMGRPPKDGEFMHVVGNFSDIRYAEKAMKIEWMNAREMSQAIPPAYSEYIARFAPR